MAVALIVAAGSGERLGEQSPKAFVTLAGKPMLQWSVEAFQAARGIEAIVVALPHGAEAPVGTLGVPGGPSRSHSVRAALDSGAVGDPVVVHDAARPFVTAEIIERVMAELADHACDGAVAAAPVADTIKQAAADGTVVATLERSLLWAVQTPQAFRRVALARALDADDATLAAATDDAALVEAAGGSVRVVRSSPDNLKVTTATDLRIAEALAAHRC